MRRAGFQKEFIHSNIILLGLIIILNTTLNAAMVIPTVSKTALVTGSTDGIGLTTAKNLSNMGYNVILHGRNPTRLRKAIQTVQTFSEAPRESIFAIESDISTIQGCKSLVYSVQSILADNNLSLDVLMNNAGVFEKDLTFTDDELEMTFAVNVMAPFVITSQLLPQMLNTNRQSRIVIASSISQCRSIDNWDDLQFTKRPYSSHRSYSESKLMDAMLAAEFSSLLTKANIGTDIITCNSLDPGTVNTKMLLAGWGPCGIDVEDALDQTWQCTNSQVKDISGSYFCWKNVSKTLDSYKVSERKRLWDTLASKDPSSAKMWNVLNQLSSRHKQQKH